MKVFLDANILVSVLNKEYPVFSYSARIVSLCDHPRYEVYTSPLCLAIAFYFAEKRSKKTARARIAIFAEKLRITHIDEKTVAAAVANKRIHDLEDGLQYYSAINSGCNCIVTEDTHDFYFSEIPVLNSRNFMEHYVFNHNP